MAPRKTSPTISPSVALVITCVFSHHFLFGLVILPTQPLLKGPENLSSTSSVSSWLALHYVLSQPLCIPLLNHLLPNPPLPSLMASSAVICHILTCPMQCSSSPFLLPSTIFHLHLLFCSASPHIMSCVALTSSFYLLQYQSLPLYPLAFLCNYVISLIV